MILIKTVRFLHLITYMIVAAQLMYYVFVMGDALKAVHINNFIEQRKIVDPMVHTRHVPVYYACLLLSLVMLVLLYKQWNSIVFISVLIAVLLLVADIILGLKLNGPINTLVNEQNISSHGIDWEGIRLQWIEYIKIRGVIIMVGMVSLLAGLVFGKAS